MCSIEGTTNVDYDISIFSDLNKCRGPDGTHFFKDDKVNFAHNLLEISPNPKRKIQPYVTEKGNVLVFNGEIYGLNDNQWDVEWLANIIEDKGIQRLKEGVNGMWALAWYEPAKNKLTLCRDHFGIKPLYYTQIESGFYFSSTLPPLAGLHYEEYEEKISYSGYYYDQIYKFCDGFNPGKETIVHEVNKLYPGQIIELDVVTNKITRKNSLWDSNWKNKTNFLWNKWELDEKLSNYISQVTNAPGIKKTISLSGGLDSNLIASISRNKDRISASSVHWEDKNIGESDPSRHMMDELSLSKETTKWLNMDHYVTTIPHDNDDYHDEVYNAMFGIPSWDIQRLLPRFYNITQAAKNGNKIYITGDCADEILTGYNGDFKMQSNGVLDINQLFRILGFRSEKNPDHKFCGAREVGRMTNHEIWGDCNVNNRQLFQLLYHCDGFCTVLDHMCGYYGMEARVPFLHQDLVKYLISIPGQQKLQIPFDKIDKSSMETRQEKEEYIYFMMGHYKGILREHMSHHYIPGVRNRMRKTGFSNPWDARDSEKNKNLRYASYEVQKNKLKSNAVDFKDNLLYNLYHDIKTENINE